MGELGLRMIYPGPKLSAPGKDSKKYPYLLRDLEVTRPNQVWSTDITYIRMPGGFVYLTAVLSCHKVGEFFNLNIRGLKGIYSIFSVPILSLSNSNLL